MISAIIVNYFSSDVLARCLTSLSTAAEIIIIDNSVDATETEALHALAKEFEFTLQFNTYNAGFAVAVNQAAKLAKGDAYLLINPDAFLVNDALKRLSAELGEGVAVTGPRILFPDGKEQKVSRRKTPTPKRAVTKFLGLARFAKDPLDYGDLPDSIQAVDALSGSCMLVKANVFWELGGMDESYRLHCEDLDFFMQVLNAGYTSVFVPDALAIHEKGHSSSHHPVWVSWHLHRGMLLYYKKFFRQKYTSIMWTAVVTSVYLRFVVHASSATLKQLLR